MRIDSREEGELVDSFITSPALPARRTLQLYGTRWNDPISDYCWLTRFKSIRETANLSRTKSRY